MIKGLQPYYKTPNGDFLLHKGDSRNVATILNGVRFDMVFADPPYFLSNGGFSVQAGKCVSVNKGDWDASHGLEADTQFNYQWVKGCRELLKESGTIWVCGSYHNIFSVVKVLTELDFRILNAVTWQKTNPPPNLSCRFFTHSTEILVWARKSKKVAHYYNYELMRKLAGDRQMTDVWRMPAIAPWEKTCGKHPAQKPLALVVRAILASTQKDDMILDPFAGSSTTGIAANMLGRKFVGIEQNPEFLKILKARRILLNEKHDEWAKKIPDLRGLEFRSF